MKESSFEPGETLYAGAFEVDGKDMMIVARRRALVLEMALKMDIPMIDVREFKPVKVVEA